MVEKQAVSAVIKLGQVHSSVQNFDNKGVDN